MLSNAQMGAIEKHIAHYIGEPQHVFHEIISLELHIDIQVVSPTRERKHYTLITMGMSEKPMRVPKGEQAAKYAELMICLPRSWRLDEEAIEEERFSFPLAWLRLMARFPHDAGTFLAPGHTIPNGDPPEPLAPDSEFCCLLIREPRTTPDGFRVLEAGKKRIHFYAVLPVYREEMDFKLKHGFPALDALLTQHGVTELLNMHKPSVVACGVWSKNRTRLPRRENRRRKGVTRRRLTS